MKLNQHKLQSVVRQWSGPITQTDGDAYHWTSCIHEGGHGEFPRKEEAVFDPFIYRLLTL